MRNLRPFGLVLAVICMALLVFSSGGATRGLAGKSPEELAFAASGAKLETVCVNGWAKIADKEKASAEISRRITGAMAAFGFPPEQVTVTHHAAQYQRTIRADGVRDGIHVTVIVQSVFGEAGHTPPETYLVVNVEYTHGSGDLAGTQRQIADVIAENGGVATISTCLSGIFDGKLKKEKMASVIKNCFASVRGAITEGIASPQFASYSGYTPLIERTLHIGAQRINLNIALRYNPLENRTYITVGSPVITMEY